MTHQRPAMIYSDSPATRHRSIMDVACRLQIGRGRSPRHDTNDDHQVQPIKCIPLRNSIPRQKSLYAIDVGFPAMPWDIPAVGCYRSRAHINVILIHTPAITTCMVSSQALTRLAAHVYYKFRSHRPKTSISDDKCKTDHTDLAGRTRTDSSSTV